MTQCAVMTFASPWTGERRGHSTSEAVGLFRLRRRTGVAHRGVHDLAIIVTGVASGAGFAITQELAEDAARVTGCDVNAVAGANDSFL